MIRTLLLFLSFALYASASIAEETYQLLFQRTESCQDVTLLVYSHSTHPGGNPHNLLNERNRGVGFRCQIRPRSPYYFTINGLHNSQFGDTFAAGLGGSWPVLQLKRVTVSLGAEVPWIYYEHPRARKAMWGFLPIATVGLTLDLPHRAGTIGYVQYHLADTGVQLYAIQYRRAL